MCPYCIFNSEHFQQINTTDNEYYKNNYPKTVSNENKMNNKVTVSNTNKLIQKKVSDTNKILEQTVITKNKIIQ